ncbi:hypothetical protein [Methylophilus sp. QUAN]|uniref:hypothetical protein n=1 Tax=Methylophilus sp. QUAN TaxID=2781020 RepID=UPI00188DCCD0|nr:hypothetical protein [Methylophilus sp. QUAN]MBF4991019.1 hypothetical protein [Methylophilus sp. QUAN]
MGINSKAAFKQHIHSVRSIAGLTIFAIYSTTLSAASMPPAKILCTPSNQTRAGIEDLPPNEIEAQLFEYGGKITIKQEGNKFKYIHGVGKDYYKVKYKASYSKDFAEPFLGIFFSEDYGWADPSGFLVLVNKDFESKFHIDLKTLKYYGYDSGFGVINNYSGSCTILNNK